MSEKISKRRRRILKEFLDRILKERLMSITSYYRGHPIIYENNEWLYKDTRETTEKERPCIRCGELPTAEGYDACLGYVKGVKSACCGHGQEPAYSMPN